MKKKLKPVKPIIWFTGLPGSGKTKLSSSIYNYLKKKIKIKLIDGDKFRNSIKNFNYDQKSRNIVGNKKLALAKRINLQGNIVLVSGVASNKIWRKKTKLRCKNLYEIYLKCPIRVLKLRNKKIYKIINKPFKYEEGDSVDLIVDTNKLLKHQSTNKVLRFLKRKKLI